MFHWLRSLTFKRPRPEVYYERRESGYTIWLWLGDRHHRVSQVPNRKDAKQVIKTLTMLNSEERERVIKIAERGTQLVVNQ